MQKKSKFTRKYDWMHSNGTLYADEKVLTDEQKDLVASVYPACWRLAKTITPKIFQHKPECVELSYEIALKAAFRAAMKFDKSYGIKFITYAYNAMTKSIWSYWWSRKDLQKKPPKFINFHDTNGYESNQGEDYISCFFADKKQESQLHGVDKRIDLELLDTLLAMLKAKNPKHHMIMCQRLGLGDAEPMTLDAVGEYHGCSKENIRQIVVRAMDFMKQRARAMGARA